MWTYCDTCNKKYIEMIFKIKQSIQNFFEEFACQRAAISDPNETTIWVNTADRNI